MKNFYVFRSSEREWEAPTHEEFKGHGAKKVVFYTGYIPEKLVKENLSGEFRYMNEARLQPRKSFRRHRHTGMTEMFKVIKGELYVEFDGDENVTLNEGDMIIMPKGVWHKQMNKTNEVIYYLSFGVDSGGQTETDESDTVIDLDA
ncbi:cupin domain-containing protein [Patescibacteria group bacterium]